MKKLLFAIAFTCLSVSSWAQNDPRCKCLNIFAEAAEKIDTNDVDKIADKMSEMYINLKRSNPEFKKCSDYYSLSYGLWTIGKLRLTQIKTSCPFSEKVMKLINEGPLIYEMKSQREELVEKEYSKRSAETIEDPKISEHLSKEAEKYMTALMGGDKKTFKTYMHPEYMAFAGEEGLMKPVEMMPVMMKQREVIINAIRVLPVKTLVKEGDVLSTFVSIEVESSTKGKTAPTITQVNLAISKDNGKHWYFIEMRRQKLMALGVILDDVHPIALQQKKDNDFIAQYPAKNAEELGKHYCNCANKLKENDIFSHAKCVQILKKHPLWKDKAMRTEVKTYVKNNCEEKSSKLFFNK